MASAWSTDSVVASEALSYWQDVVCQTIVLASTECPQRERFHAHLSGWVSGGLRFASFTPSSHEIVRRPTHISSLVDVEYLISLQQRGDSDIDQGDCRFVL